MAKKKAAPPPDPSATTVMNDATRLAQQDLPAGPSNTQLFAKAVQDAEAAQSATTVDGKERDPNATRNLASPADHAQILSTQRASARPKRNLTPWLLAVSAALLAAVVGLMVASSFD